MIILDKLDIIYNAHTLINPFKNDWKNNKTTNCYAYALGIDVPANSLESDRICYNPGYFGGKFLIDHFTKKELIDAVLLDTDRFKLYSYIVPLDYKLMPGEWKIAIFGASSNKPGEYEDFHFLRQTKNGVWMHKLGFDLLPTNLDSNNEVITDPSKCFLDYFYNDQHYKYDYLDTLVLKK